MSFWAGARAELTKHVREIRVSPKQVGWARFYVAEGEWNLLGGYRGSSLNDLRPRMAESGWLRGLAMYRTRSSYRSALNWPMWQHENKSLFRGPHKYLVRGHPPRVFVF